MKQYKRLALPRRSSTYLLRKSRGNYANDNLQLVWKSARRTKAISVGVLQTLHQMAGSRQRCMFCEDSHGTDIDHFYPKTPYWQRMFNWDNMILCCGGCNSAKNNYFELLPDDTPQLINPTTENPWIHIAYESTTGMLAPAFMQDGTASPKGEYTCDPNRMPVNFEAAIDGRKRTANRLRRSVNSLLRAIGTATEAESISEYIASLHDNDDYGLLAWFYIYAGSNELPFSALKSGHQNIWDESVKIAKDRCLDQ